jgi:hypothetical protein
LQIAMQTFGFWKYAHCGRQACAEPQLRVPRTQTFLNFSSDENQAGLVKHRLSNTSYSSEILQSVKSCNYM